MKQHLHFITTFLLVFFTVSSTISCSEENNEDIQTDWTDNGNTLIHTSSQSFNGYTITQVSTFQFKNNTCTSATSTFTYPSEIIAQQVYEQMSSSIKQHSTLHKNQITIDVTFDLKGMTKEDIKEIWNSQSQIQVYKTIISYSKICADTIMYRKHFVHY